MPARRKRGAEQSCRSELLLHPPTTAASLVYVSRGMLPYFLRWLASIEIYMPGSTMPYAQPANLRALDSHFRLPAPKTRVCASTYGAQAIRGRRLSVPQRACPQLQFQVLAHVHGERGT
jgi:hypothetical protein